MSFWNHLTGNWPAQSISERTPISLLRITVVVFRRVLPHHSSQFLAHSLLPAKTCLVMQVDMPTEELDSNDSLRYVIPQNHDTTPIASHASPRDMSACLPVTQRNAHHVTFLALTTTLCMCGPAAGPWHE